MPEASKGEGMIYCTTWACPGYSENGEFWLYPAKPNKPDPFKVANQAARFSPCPRCKKSKDKEAERYRRKAYDEYTPDMYED